MTYETAAAVAHSAAEKYQENVRGISMNDKGNSVSPVSQRIVIDGCTVILHYAASSDPAAAHAVQNSLFNFQSSPQPIFCNNGESMR